MSDEAELARVWCKGCSAVFVAFLQKMADHNAKLVCPNCGTVNTPGRFARASERNLNDSVNAFRLDTVSRHVQNLPHRKSAGFPCSPR